MTTAAITSGAAAATALENFAARPNVPESEKVAGVAREFEALLLRQILTEARKPMFASGLMPKDQGKGIYDDLVNFQLAQSISSAGTLGLANQLEKELGRQLQAGTAPAKS